MVTGEFMDHIDIYLTLTKLKNLYSNALNHFQAVNLFLDQETGESLMKLHQN